MEKIADSLLSLIGNTPLVRLSNLSKDIPAEILAKVEFFNPSGSIKDRIAIFMLEEAEKSGKIKPGATIIEPTSGNTGIALSFVCALKGYKMIAVMPEVVSVERRRIMETFGAKVEIIKCVDKTKGLTRQDIENAAMRAAQLAKQIPNSFEPNQFDNFDNPRAHAKMTATEILEQTGGDFSAFVAACGTGGTFSGVSRVLKEKHPEIKRVVVEPAGSAVLSGCDPGFHNIQGIGEGFIPKVMDVNLSDEIIQVADQEAILMARRLWREEGVMGGISSGANVYAALQIGKDMQEGEKIVTIIPDSGLRYFSTELFAD